MRGRSGSSTAERGTFRWLAPVMAISLDCLIDGSNRDGYLDKHHCCRQLTNEHGAVGHLKLQLQFGFGQDLSPK